MNCKNTKCNQPMIAHESNGITVCECHNPKCDFRYITREPAWFLSRTSDDIYSEYGATIKPYSEPAQVSYIYVSKTPTGIESFTTLSDAICAIAPHEQWNESSGVNGMYVSESGKRILCKEA